MNEVEEIPSCKRQFACIGLYSVFCFIDNIIFYALILARRLSIQKNNKGPTAVYTRLLNKILRTETLFIAGQFRRIGTKWICHTQIIHSIVRFYNSIVLLQKQSTPQTVACLTAKLIRLFSRNVGLLYSKNNNQNHTYAVF